MTIIDFKQIAAFETPEWKSEMKKLGDTMSNKKVRQTIFIHGTFVGKDPLGVFGIMKSFGVSPKITHFLEQTSKKITDVTSKDIGNFLPTYNVAYENAIQNSIACRLFNWNSMNNHIGRLCAVPELAHDMAEHIHDLSDDDRILLIGHSHAGQLFALLTVFLQHSEKADKLTEILMGTDGFNQSQFKADLNKIATVQLDFVTLGTPVRYRWGNYQNYNLLNLVNHRSNSTIYGVLDTRDGDYVQQWGTDGKDLAPFENKLLSEGNKQLLTAKNQQLDEFLDKGVSSLPSIGSFVFDLLGATAESTRRQALKENGDLAGTSLFIDYQDQGLDPIKTLFGHGYYTRTNSMLFNTDLIVKHLYSGI